MSNEAAERLRDWARVNAPEVLVAFGGWLDAALAAERKAASLATVERIRTAALGSALLDSDGFAALSGILDAEAAR